MKTLLVGGGLRWERGPYLDCNGTEFDSLEVVQFRQPTVSNNMAIIEMVGLYS